MRDGHADFPSQASDHDAQDQSGDPGEHGAGLDGGGALRHLGADGLEMEQAGECP